MPAKGIELTASTARRLVLNRFVVGIELQAAPAKLSDLGSRGAIVQVNEHELVGVSRQYTGEGFNKPLFKLVVYLVKTVP